MTTITTTDPASAASEPMALDLGDVQARTLDEAVLTVSHPQTGAATAMRITLSSPDSAAFRQKMNRMQDNAMREAVRRPKGRLMTAEEQQSLSIKSLVAATLGWEGVRMGGEALPCTAENAHMVYDAYPWLREQVAAFQGDRQNFFGE